MAVRDIVLYPDDVLTTETELIEEVDDSVRQLVQDLTDTMYDAPGVGLAAPQIGVLRRVAVVDVRGPDDGPDLHVLINPEIIEREGRITWEEGCLSFPGLYEKIDRNDRVTVRALGVDGEPHEIEAEGLLAVALQHEIDHLHGILYIDHLSRLKRSLALKKYKKLLRAHEEKQEARREEVAEVP